MFRVPAALFIQHAKHMYHITYHTWPVWLHIFPHSFTKQHNFQKHVKKYVCRFSLQEEVFHANGQNETNCCFSQSCKKQPNSYNTHIP